MRRVFKAGIFVFLGVVCVDHSFAQAVMPIEVSGASLQEMDSVINLSELMRHKRLPYRYEKEALVALSHFPELRNTRVKFRMKKSFSTLETRPGFLSMFMPRGHRSYVITISTKTIDKLTSLTLKNLPEMAKIGVIGHELSHVADFSSRTFWQSFKIALGHTSPSYLDSLEFNTDKICIQHGLGKELEVWSSYIRETMHTQYWRGADFVNKGDTRYERYMNPSTIEKYLLAERQKASSTPVNALWPNALRLF
ncbi:MAG: hypothetical protein ABI687_03665 [Flavitalea sp.]